MQKTIERREETEESTAEVRELMHVMLNADTYTSLQAVSALGGPALRATREEIGCKAVAHSGIRVLILEQSTMV